MEKPKAWYNGITISDVNKTHLKIIAYLVGSWALAYVATELFKDPRFLGLAPVINYVAYVIEKELKNEGYIEAIRNTK